MGSQRERTGILYLSALLPSCFLLEERFNQPKTAWLISVLILRKMAIPPVLLPRTAMTFSVAQMTVNANLGRLRSAGYQSRP